ncbi:4-hydroxythreonine-4-phosphate dehydrogenase PdxA [Mastigocoleus sp. MO_188.B34]|uniref:4-hydroxythreonine-4-phosphate dehydrogenase PdxA n=1 Tax=Mastigocoleus sp. MO_188.B34 TaxID=3036635 RepID=UPI00263A3281|nr:4-hydroxythreonine-4-phosphate dehydrogenase PdxA [Mastigocoleus sp. MO_188.B34]MDJ0693686.1 4-hydroxythreonine-4-phosphate dehydrogenase PdxA [Mastigocoleus sp. MO_188.B34]
MTNSRLAITLGDPAGIGGEVILKALADPKVYENCELTVVGSRSLLLEIYTKLNLVHNCSPLADPEKLSILDVDLGNEDLHNLNSSESNNSNKIIIGEGNAASGAASFAYMETAINCALQGEFDGIVTGPIAKSAWKAAGHHYPGQTELLAQKSGVEKFGMLFVARSPHTNWTLVTLLATTHIPLEKVPQVLTPELMTQKLDLLLKCLKQDFGIEKPKIAIAGLNPHSGEGGQLGSEEQEWLIPWLEQQRQKYPSLQIDGPIPPDTMWVKPGQAWYGQGKVTPADGYLALYHDQGLIPVKLMAFDRAVNTSIGLPFVRTSPDHGTAFDIAGKGIADATSMKTAIQLAAELVSHRKLGVRSQES